LADEERKASVDDSCTTIQRVAVLMMRFARHTQYHIILWKIQCHTSSLCCRPKRGRWSGVMK